MAKRKSEFKPLLFTTTVRNPKRIKALLNILSTFNGKILTNELAEEIMGALISYGLYRPMKKSSSVKEKWNGTKTGEFSNILLSQEDIDYMLDNNRQHHKEAGFDKGWPSRFATVFDFTKELGFVYFWQNEKIIFSEIGLKLANSIDVKLSNDYILVSDSHPEFEQEAFLHALAKSQRNNPFVRVLNENVPLILLLEVIKKINGDKDFNGAGILKKELPLIIFWKDNDSEKLYQLIKSIRKTYKYSPTEEIIYDTCIKDIMGDSFKEFKVKSVLIEYPDEFIRKMRLTGLISLRGGGRFIDINNNEIEKVNYILKEYTNYSKFETEKDYFDYMAKVDNKLLSLETKKLTIEDNNKYLSKWTGIYSFKDIKNELNILSNRGLTKDGILKYLTNPVRLEFLTALAIKSKFPDVKVVPNYPCDDEGIPTSTAGGTGNQGDIECFDNGNGILVEVTMAEGRSQTTMEVWPISRHLEKFSESCDKSMCYFIAPSIFKDSERQIKFVKQEDNLNIISNTINDFVEHLETSEKIYNFS